MKDYIVFDGVPTIRFAHKFITHKYANTIRAARPGQGKIEVCYTLEGVLTVVCENGETILVPPHCVLCNLHTQDIAVHSDGFHEHHTVCFDMPAPFTEAANEDGGLLLPFITSFPEGNNKILHYIDEIIRAQTMHTKGKMANVGVFYQILDAIDRHNRENTHVDDLSYTNYKYIKKAKEYIYAHLSESIRQADIAAHLHISSEYLCNIFKSGENIPVMQFINRVKMEQIRNLMENKGLTLSQASALYGYADPNYVSRLYKKYFHNNITDFKRRK